MAAVMAVAWQTVTVGLLGVGVEIGVDFGVGLALCLECVLGLVLPQPTTTRLDKRQTAALRQKRRFSTD
jgi:predicted phage tail protein